MALRSSGFLCWARSQSLFLKVCGIGLDNHRLPFQTLKSTFYFGREDKEGNVIKPLLRSRFCGAVLVPSACRRSEPPRPLSRAAASAKYTICFRDN